MAIIGVNYNPFYRVSSKFSEGCLILNCVLVLCCKGLLPNTAFFLYDILFQTNLREFSQKNRIEGHEEVKF